MIFSIVGEGAGGMFDVCLREQCEVLERCSNVVDICICFVVGEEMANKCMCSGVEMICRRLATLQHSPLRGSRRDSLVVCCHKHGGTTIGRIEGVIPII